MARKLGKVVRETVFVALDTAGDSVAEFRVCANSDNGKWLVIDESGGMANGVVVAEYAALKDAMARAKKEATSYTIAEAR